MHYREYAKACDNYTEAKRQLDALRSDTHPKVTRRTISEYIKYRVIVMSMEETLTSQKVKGK